MNNLRIFEPSFDEPMEQMFRRFMTPWRHDKHLDVMDIRVDVVEKDDMYKVRADLPGVNKDDIKVSVDLLAANSTRLQLRFAVSDTGPGIALEDQRGRQGLAQRALLRRDVTGFHAGTGHRRHQGRRQICRWRAQPGPAQEGQDAGGFQEDHDRVIQLMSHGR